MNYNMRAALSTFAAIVAFATIIWASMHLQMHKEITVGSILVIDGYEHKVVSIDHGLIGIDGPVTYIPQEKR